ncbi:helix-hairpin-helix domain-containing protein [Tengunoibacter tsumagoiensis]|uniref:Crossover junction endonuclease MUS81-like HHH domain-containing protein n=1 Tax=Tengunoibacter tsumagoiensis TaxID=2014871 RepID=A0A402A266_9CHLR|nr:helix-hairpin-helix domain-containing protein [Tengunoibacter tsumagoiensis]GCE13152.1 hypothetical protein KTT_30110 [Tengunoibacter tsumagoiensis]
MSIMQITQTIQIMPSAPARRRKRSLQPTLPGMEMDMAIPPKVTNRQIAEVLASIADMLTTQQANPYRIQAYRNAARGVLNLSEPAADILARGESLPIPGLGDRLRSRIAELVRAGTMTFQNGFCWDSIPQGVRTLMSIEHIGTYTALRLYDELGIDSIEKLWTALQQHTIRQLPGFGTRSEARLRTAVERILRERQRLPVGGAA